MRGLIWKLPVLVILAGLSWWLTLDQTDPTSPEPVADSKNADYFLNRFEAVEMDASGKPVRDLAAVSMHHYPNDDSTELNHPILHIHNPIKPSWRIESEKGYVSANGELVLLAGNVAIDRPAATGYNAIAIRTQELRVRMEDDYAETDRAVDIRFGIHKMKGVGMTAHFTAPIRVRLLADVGGIHAVQ